MLKIDSFFNKTLKDQVIFAIAVYIKGSLQLKIPCFPIGQYSKTIRYKDLLCRNESLFT